MDKKRQPIFYEEITCDYCKGNQYIECCSVEGEDCERILCPVCKGIGKIRKRKDLKELLSGYKRSDK